MADYRELFTVDINTNEALVLIVIKGFFTTESYEQYKSEATKAILSIETGNRTVKVLSDLRECPVQSKDIAQDSEWMQGLEKYVIKTATVLSSALHKLQLQRSVTGDTVRFFDTMEAAQEWIEEEG